MVAVTLDRDSVRSSAMLFPSSRVNCCNRSLLFEHILYAVRKHSIGCSEHVERLPKQDDLPVSRGTVTKETLMDQLSGNPGLLMNRVLAKCLVGCIDIDLHVNELEVRVHLFVQESNEGLDVLWPFIARFDSEIG